MEVLLKACKEGHLAATVVAVISSHASAEGLKIAQSYGVATELVDHTLYKDRSEFDDVLAKKVEAYQPELLVLAGFMRILQKQFVQQYLGKMINLHPSLLPKYKGLNTHQRALDAKDRFAGASIHYVTPELDGGPVIMQVKVSVDEKDTSASLAARILPLEHGMLIKVVAMIVDGILKLEGNCIQYNGSLLPSPIQVEPNEFS